VRVLYGGSNPSVAHGRACRAGQPEAMMVQRDKMQNELDIVQDVSTRLDGANIRYMLTGSMAMNYYAQPRMTRDIDVVVALQSTDAARIVELFSPDYYVSREAVDSSIVHQSLFNVIHNESVIKVDFIIRKQSEYRLAEFNRRQRIKIEYFETWIVSKEDLILSKMFWAKDIYSELQLRDVKNLVSTGCDRTYIERWARELGIVNLWQEVINE
jgi:hypothetical protein